MIEGLVIDSFAGGGGASTGIERALGRAPDVAVNHDPEAVAMHAANHPGTIHYCQNIWQADPAEVVRRAGGGSVALAWFSPDCKHFSKAKGNKPVKRNIRDLAWVVVRWAKRVRPRVILLENVEEFRDWGPLIQVGPDRWKPCPDRKGQTFDAWTAALRRQGYAVEWRELRACDYGAPTIRKRLFLIARCDGRPIVWPDPTHGPGLLPYRTAADCIDWQMPCPSIFLTRDEARAVGVKRPLAENTLRRIARGIRKFVIEAKEPFIVPVTHVGDTRAHGTTEPLRTVTSAKRGEFAVVTPTLVKNMTHNAGGRADDPLSTTLTGNHHYLASPTLIQTGYGERPGQAPRTPGLDKPIGTVVAGGVKHALVQAFLAQHNTERTGAPKAGRSATEPFATVTAAGSQINVVAAHLERTFGRSAGAATDEPAPTLATRAHDAVVTSHLAKLKGTCRHGQATNEPMPTIQAGGQHVAEVRAFLMKYYGTGGQDAACGEPMHTLTARARMGLVTVEGVDYRIVDIGMRMLTARELFRAQGFDDAYVIDPVVAGKPLTKEAQIRMCGNSVCPPVAEALVRANFHAVAAPAVAAE